MIEDIEDWSEDQFRELFQKHSEKLTGGTIDFGEMEPVLEGPNTRTNVLEAYQSEIKDVTSEGIVHEIEYDIWILPKKKVRYIFRYSDMVEATEIVEVLLRRYQINWGPRNELKFKLKEKGLENDEADSLVETLEALIEQKKGEGENQS